MIVCRSEGEIERIRQAGVIVGRALELAGKAITPGAGTLEINAKIESFIRSRGARPAFKGYRGFPAASCISINEEVVHGIPGSRKIESGQLVSIDIGVELNGYFADAATTFGVGRVSDQDKALMVAGERALEAGIEMARSGNYLFDISAAIQRVAEEAGFSVVREYVGHGIGRAMHEEPQIPNYAQAGRGPKLNNGMVFALEPMVNAGSHEVKVLADKWTVVTKDGKRSVHYEHTVAVADSGPQVLTSL